MTRKHMRKHNHTHTHTRAGGDTRTWKTNKNTARGAQHHDHEPRRLLNENTTDNNVTAHSVQLMAVSRPSPQYVSMPTRLGSFSHSPISLAPQDVHMQG